jgi:predicted nucleic acid-binding protein
MILVDTSVWVDFLHTGLPELSKLLRESEVLGHPFVQGELACGNMKNRDEILHLISSLTQVPKAEDFEVLELISNQKLYGHGLTLVDIHLLASALLANCLIWTRDKKLVRFATKLGLHFKEPR